MENYEYEFLELWNKIVAAHIKATEILNYDESKCYEDYDKASFKLGEYTKESDPEKRKQILEETRKLVETAEEKVAQYESSKKNQEPAKEEEEQTQESAQKAEEGQTQEPAQKAEEETTQEPAQENAEKTKKLTELLSNLADLQSQLTTLRVQRARTGIKDAIDTRVTNMSSYLQTQAKRYRANSETVKGILEDYEKKLTELKQEHENNIKSDVQEKDRQEAEEIRIIGNLDIKKNERDDYMRSPEYSQYRKNYATLQREARKLMDKGDIEGAQKKLTELQTKQAGSKIAEFDREIKQLETKLQTTRDKIAELKSNIDGAKIFYETQIDKATEGKDTALQENVEKQGVFAKLFGAIYDKIGGKEKFEQRVAGPIKQQIEDIGKAASRMAGSVKTGVTTTFSTIRQKTRDAKSIIINGIKDKIKEAIDRTQTKINNYEKNEGKENNEQEEYKGEEI